MVGAASGNKPWNVVAAMKADLQSTVTTTDYRKPVVSIGVSGKPIKTVAQRAAELAQSVADAAVSRKCGYRSLTFYSTCSLSACTVCGFCLEHCTCYGI